MDEPDESYFAVLGKAQRLAFGGDHVQIPSHKEDVLTGKCVTGHCACQGFTGSLRGKPNAAAAEISLHFTWGTRGLYSLGSLIDRFGSVCFGLFHSW